MGTSPEVKVPDWSTSALKGWRRWQGSEPSFRESHVLTKRDKCHSLCLELLANSKRLHQDRNLALRGCHVLGAMQSNPAPAKGSDLVKTFSEGPLRHYEEWTPSVLSRDFSAAAAAAFRLFSSSVLLRFRRGVPSAGLFINADSDAICVLKCSRSIIQHYSLLTARDPQKCRSVSRCVRVHTSNIGH